MASSKEQIAILRKKLEEVEKLQKQTERLKNEAEKAKMEAKKAREEAEQQGYDLRLAEIKETFRVKVLVVCRISCTQTWDEALN